MCGDVHPRRRLLAWPLLIGAAAGLGLSGPAKAQNDLRIVEIKLDRPTLHALGVQILISGDKNRNASVGVRYRRVADTAWTDGMPFLRVLPETVFVETPDQFAGSVFDLEPDTEYELELRISDPDGGGSVEIMRARTRPVPREEPMNPRPVPVSSFSQLQIAMRDSEPGDVITIAPGVYTFEFLPIFSSGTAENPIIIQGADAETTILDGGGCRCNIIEAYGNYTYIQDLTFRNAQRALRFQGAETEGNVARRLIIRDVESGIGSRNAQRDFYICDNTIDGRLQWPWPYEPNANQFLDFRGVDINGDGHVICHNYIRGFGDPIVNKTVGSRSWDVYGNDILDSFDGVELDESSGNVRVYRNRWTNVDSAISLQPVMGGPGYVIRNVLQNVGSEPIKMKSLGGVNESSGTLIYNNSFSNANLALNLQTPVTGHNFRIVNNLFVGPERTRGPRTIDWTGRVNEGEFDFNGYYPDGSIWLGVVQGRRVLFNTFAQLKASGIFEANGTLLVPPVFAADFVGPDDRLARFDPPSFVLAENSNAIDAGQVIAGVSDRYVGDGPDLGAVERGCPEPHYGPRPKGDLSVAKIRCRTPGPINLNIFVSAASFLGGAVSPGEIVSAFPAGVGPDELLFAELDEEGRFPTELGGVRVLFDGIPGRIIFTTSGQTNVVAPFALLPNRFVRVRIEANGLLSNAVPLPVVKARPGVFSLTQTGVGQAAVLNEDFSVNSAANPADRGSTVQLFLTGGGTTSPVLPDGAVTGFTQPFPDLIARPVVRIGGVEARVTYAGGAPGLIYGAVQINAEISPASAAGPDVPLEVAIAGNSSRPGLTMAVE